MTGPEANTPCRCGHSSEAHEHYRRGSECAQPGCGCLRYRPQRSVFGRPPDAPAPVRDEPSPTADEPDQVRQH